MLLPTQHYRTLNSIASKTSGKDFQEDGKIQSYIYQDISNVHA